MSVCVCVWVCAACLFRLKSRHLSSRWNWASLLPRNAQIVCTHFSSSFPSSHCTSFGLSIMLDTWQYWISQRFFSPISPNANANFNWAMRQNFAGQVKANLKNNLNNEKTKGKKAKVQPAFSVVHVIVDPLFHSLPLSSLAIVPFLLSCLCQMKSSAKAARNETRCEKFAWQSSWTN